MKEAGFDKVPTTLPELLVSASSSRRSRSRPASRLGNAVGDANGFANWMLWSHGGALVDEDGKVIINSMHTPNCRASASSRLRAKILPSPSVLGTTESSTMLRVAAG